MGGVVPAGSSVAAMSETMRAVVVTEAGGPLELQERPVPEPGPGEALVAVDACGICHSDMFAEEGVCPGVTFPVVPGHEVAGRVAALGEGVTAWSEGQRVGVGWYGGACGQCGPCRAGELISCTDMGISGITMDGGYADYVVVRATALVALPDCIGAEQAAPLLCAGVTTYNGLRKTGAVAARG